MNRPLKWYGGKHYLAKQIIELMPPHLHYVEPYFGGGAVLFARDPNKDWLIDEVWKLKNGEKVPSSLPAGGKKKRKMEEIVWMNY